MIHRHTQRTEKGFTLFELIISVSLGLVIMLSGAYMAGQLLRAAALNTEQSELDNAKQLVNEAIETDFKQAGNYLYKVTPAVATATNYTDEVIADLPRVWYRFDDAAGSTTAKDQSGNSFDASITGTATFGSTGALVSDSNPSATIAGRGNGMVFGPNFGTPSSDFSVEWWLNPATVSDFTQYISSNRGGTYGTWGFLVMGSGSLYCGSNAATALSPAEIAPGTVKVNEWQHFVFTYSGSNGSLYLNGKLLGRKVMDPPTGWDTMSLQDINGRIDELAVYYHALTPERIRAHYIAAVAPAIPQDEPGIRTPLFPLAQWAATGSGFQRPSEAISLDAAGQNALILSADEQFSPVTTDRDFFANTGTLVTRPGVRAALHAGDNLLVIDYTGNQSVLVRVNGDPQIITATDGTARWSIPITGVGTDAPAWTILASQGTDLTGRFPPGSSVVRLNPPIIYAATTSGTTSILTRTVGDARQTLALGATSFTVQRSASSTPAAWTISYLLESEQIESSTDENYKQLGAASLTLTPNALNPGTR